MGNKLKRLLLVSRPLSWPNTAYPFAAAYLVTGGGFDLTLIVGTLYFLIPYNLLMYGINDVFDYESDIRNPRKGGVEGMREQRAFHPTIVRSIVYANALPIVYLAWVSDLGASLILSFVVFLALAYSVPPLRFKERAGLDSLTSSLHFVGPMLYAASLTHSLTATLIYTFAFLAWGIASHAFGAVQDILPDRMAGIKSIATALGARTTVWISMVFYCIACVLLLAAGNAASSIIAVLGIAYALNVAPYLRVGDEQASDTNAGWRRFLWLNYATGFVITIVLLLQVI